ncbi:MAG: cytochrome c [Pyrinomonadaceae bacterium]|nr:cytochrome c [Pyrinomonadaceae bacterium]
MVHFKAVLVLTSIALFIAACSGTKQEGFVIADSKSYEASLFRQQCAVCHGPEGNGKTVDGKIVPSLRVGDFKFRSEAEIYNQIANGGNGMTPFRDQLTEREIRLLTDLIHNRLRAKKE